MKKKSLILILIILLVLVYFKAIRPYRQEEDIKVELTNKWNVDISEIDKLKTMKTSKPQWHGEHHKFILFESDSDSELSYIQANDLLSHKMSSDIKERIIEIEDDLEIKKEERIDFADDYYYAKRIKHIVRRSSEAKKDILYIILVKGHDNAKIYLIEDLNVLDLERSF
jgi:hypothetical protein